MLISSEVHLRDLRELLMYDDATNSWLAIVLIVLGAPGLYALATLPVQSNFSTNLYD